MKTNIITPYQAADQIKRGGKVFGFIPQLGGEVSITAIDPKLRTITIDGEELSFDMLQGLLYNYEMILPKKLKSQNDNHRSKRKNARGGHKRKSNG